MQSSSQHSSALEIFYVHKFHQRGVQRQKSSTNMRTVRRFRTASPPSGTSPATGSTVLPRVATTSPAFQGVGWLNLFDSPKHDIIIYCVRKRCHASGCGRSWNHLTHTDKKPAEAVAGRGGPSENHGAGPVAGGDSLGERC